MTGEQSGIGELSVQELKALTGVYIQLKADIYEERLEKKHSHQPTADTTKPIDAFKHSIDYQIRLRTALKRTFDGQGDFGVYGASEKSTLGYSHHIRARGEQKHAITFTDGTDKQGQACILVNVAASAYTINGQINQQKYHEMHAAAAAKFLIACAEAKYAKNPAKGLAELQQKKSLWQDNAPNKTALDVLTATKIKTLLAQRLQTAQPKPVDQPVLLSTANNQPVSAHMQKFAGLPEVQNNNVQLKSAPVNTPRAQARTSFRPASPAPKGKSK